MNQNRIHKIAFCGILTALSLCLGYLEHLIPFSVGIYGIKLGLANLSVLILLYLADLKTAFAVHITRILLSGLLFGNAFALIYSASGGLFSFAVMALLRKSKSFSPVGVSIVGGVSHNIAQLSAAIFLVEELRIAFYLPVLLISGALAGFLVGLCSLPLIHHPALQKSFSIPQKSPSEKGKKN